MAEMILPGVYIEVRAEGLIVPGQISVGNIGIVGTASKGELDPDTGVGKAILLSSYSDAIQRFGPYDSFLDPTTGKRKVDTQTPPKPNELTLVRALEQAFAFGATTIFAVRVADADVKAASHTLTKGADKVVTLAAKSPGTWGNDLKVNVAAAEENAFVEDEKLVAANPVLRFKAIKNPRNRIIHTGTNGVRTVLSGDDIIFAGTAGLKQVNIDAAGNLTFGSDLGAASEVRASYVVDKANAVKVTVRLGTVDEVYTVVNGNDLIVDITEQSSLVDAKKEVESDELPSLSNAPTGPEIFANFTGGNNGAEASQAQYEAGLNVLLNEDTHIMVGAGQDDSFGSELDKHCQKASTDVIKRDRIAVVGSAPQDPTQPDKFFDDLRGHSLASDRVIFVAPGIKTTDSGASPPTEVTLPGAYAAAAVAGLLSSLSPHISPTNKVLSVDDLERRFTAPELTQLVQARVMVLERRQGFRIVKGITTSTNSAFAQITTRRIVDYAKAGVRSAATPYIGLLNNERVRGALRATVNSFLAEMVLDEMLVSYELNVTASRDDERKGIARVTMVLRPTFSIDFIKVTMNLE
jgi:hypothetical protein